MRVRTPGFTFPMAEYSFFISGDPKTKGSWVPVAGKGGETKLRPAGKGHGKWFKRVKDELARQWRGEPLLEGPVSVALSFRLTRPKTVRRRFPTSRYDGDGDKLERAILDGLTGSVIADDGQVIDCGWEKRYTEGETGVRVIVGTDL